MQPASEHVTVNRPPQRPSQEEFAFETRFVVLNYLGQIQARSSSESSFSSSGGSGGHRLQTQSSSSSGSSHARPSSISPRAPSVSPRKSSQGAEDDSQIVAAQAYDAKVKAIHAIAQKGKAQDAKQRVNAELLRKGHPIEQLRKGTDPESRKRSIDSADGITDDGRRKISQILEKKTREARVLEELKNLARARIDEIRAHYESQEEDSSGRSHEGDEREDDSKSRASSASGISELSSSLPASSSLSHNSGMLPQGASGMLPQGVSGMIPLMENDTPSPSLYDYQAGNVPFMTPWGDGGGRGDATDFTSPLSPTRPNILDGLHKTSDSFEAVDKPKFQPKRKPRILAQVFAESIDSSKSEDEDVLSKRDGIPRPPPASRDKLPRPSEDKTKRERSPSKRGVIPKPPSEEQKPTEDQDGESGARVPPTLDREFSEESIYSGMDSPLSDLSSLTWSGRSVVSGATSSRSSVVNMNESQVKALVKTSVFPEVAVPLQEEINEQWQHWEKEYEQADYTPRKSSITFRKKRPSLKVKIPQPNASSQSSSVTGMSPIVSSTGLMSPESEVARKLGIIGDRIQEEMGDLLDKAFNDVMAIPREEVTYEVLTRVVEDDRLLHNSTGWKQVAVLLAFSQRLTVGLLQKGERGLGKLMDYSVRLIEDKAAEFIINQGGWSAISELDVSPLVSPTGDNPDFPLDIPDLPLAVEMPIEEIGINAACTLMENPNETGLHDTALGRTSGIYISDHFGSGAVGGYFDEETGAVGGIGTGANRLVADGSVMADPFENGAVGGSEHIPKSDVRMPDLLDRTISTQEITDLVRPEIALMRTISHELNREVEEARTHRFITRLTYGSLAVVVIAVGLTMLWKWKTQTRAS